MKTVIMAGGKGTRLASVNDSVPKPMVPICGVPILEREIECLRRQGFVDIILTVGHLGGQITEHFKDGSGFGVDISYYYEKEPLGTAGALFRLRNILTSKNEDSFLLLNADSMFDVDLERFEAIHRKNGGLVTLLTHPNSHPYDSGLIVSNDQGIVLKWIAKEDERPRYYQNRVNAGMHMISAKVLDDYIASMPDDQKTKWVPSGEGLDDRKYGTPVIPIKKTDIDRDVLKPLAGTGKMHVYDSPEYVKDMGTPERYCAVCKDFENGIVQAKNLSRKQRAIFLDRDGTINRFTGFVRNTEDFEMIPDSIKAIRLINEAGYLAIVVTNQPVIARGETTLSELKEIHNKMETLLGAEGAYLDGIYFCPHHPHKGYKGERPELKCDCECRKPKAGMLLKAAKEFNIDLSQSWMIGDGENDVRAGMAAGCKTGWIRDSCDHILQSPDVCGASLLDIVTRILDLNADLNLKSEMKEKDT